jgi:hypothetical protein
LTDLPLFDLLLARFKRGAVRPSGATRISRALPVLVREQQLPPLHTRAPSGARHRRNAAPTTWRRPRRGTRSTLRSPTTCASCRMSSQVRLGGGGRVASKPVGRCDSTRAGPALGAWLRSAVPQPSPTPPSLPNLLTSLSTQGTPTARARPASPASGAQRLATQVRRVALPILLALYIHPGIWIDASLAPGVTG